MLIAPSRFLPQLLGQPAGGLSDRQYCYDRRRSISALSAASIVRYDASAAITRDRVSAMQPSLRQPDGLIRAPAPPAVLPTLESHDAPSGLSLYSLSICADARAEGPRRGAAASRPAPTARMGVWIGKLRNDLPQCCRPSRVSSSIAHAAVRISFGRCQNA